MDRMDVNQAALKPEPGDPELETSAIDIALGAELRGLRAKRSLSQEQLAQMAGMNKKTVQRLEAGARPMDIAQLYQLCRALGVKPSTLIDAMEKEIGIQ